MPPVVPVLLILLVIRSIRLKILIRVNPEHRSKASIPVNPRLLQNPDNLILILVKRLLNLLKPADKQHIHPRIRARERHYPPVKKHLLRHRKRMLAMTKHTRHLIRIFPSRPLSTSAELCPHGHFRRFTAPDNENMPTTLFTPEPQHGHLSAMHVSSEFNIIVSLRGENLLSKRSVFPPPPPFSK